MSGSWMSACSTRLTLTFETSGYFGSLTWRVACSSHAWSHDPLDGRQEWVDLQADGERHIVARPVVDDEGVEDDESLVEVVDGSSHHAIVPRPQVHEHWPLEGGQPAAAERGGVQVDRVGARTRVQG